MLQMIHPEYDIPRSHISGTHSPFIAAEFANDGKRHLLLAASGSVATIKIPNILHALSKHPKLSIRLILTKSATNFLAGQSKEQPHLESLRHIKNVDGIFLDEEEWVHPWKRGQGILHIELRRWADILLISPLSANTLAKITGGFSDNLLTSVVRAWDTTVEGGSKRIMVAPAMNTMMWRHPVTRKQIKVLEEEWGVGNLGAYVVDDEGEGWFEVLRPQEKELACGDVGDGAMKAWEEVVKVVEIRLGLGH